AQYGVSGSLKTEIDGKHFHDIADKMNVPHDIPLANWQYEMLNHKANRDLNAFFELAIAHKLNICMVGGTGSGKTTFTKALADMIDTTTRIIA
ncbi:ATPase, T2SS/T4P/T4SS family, partial [Kingella kingae]